MSKKAWIIFVVICLLLLGGLIYLSERGRIDVSNINHKRIQPPTAQSGNIGDHVFGNTKSPVILVEYGDFQCPGCGQIYPALKTISEKYKGDIAYVFRNFPLTTLHPNALAAASAAESAGLQGKYWPMHDMLYQNQNDWSETSSNDRTATFVSYAKRLGLNTDKFTEALSGSAVMHKIDFDRAVGQKLGITGTPTVYLDGKQISDATTQSTMRGQTTDLDNQINAALKAHNITPPKDTVKK